MCLVVNLVFRATGIGLRSSGACAVKLIERKGSGTSNGRNLQSAVDNPAQRCLFRSGDENRKVDLLRAEYAVEMAIC